MLKAKYTIVDQWDRSRILKNEVMEFEKISELEQFLAYNRAYILKLSFTGQFNKEAN
jgi:hypothetical protein